jgi:hypothetical protein
MSPRTQGDERTIPERGFVQLSVPEEIYDEVIEFIVDRLRAQRRRASRTSRAVKAGSSGGAEDEVWEDDDLRRLMEIANDRLRKALVAIARSPDFKLSTEDLAGAAEINPGRAWGGLMSRANATLRSHFQHKTELPMYGWWDGDQCLYQINEGDAAVISNWADEHGY